MSVEMSIIMQIEEECRHFMEYGDATVKPDFVFIGQKQAKQIEDMVADMERLGLIVKSTPLPRAVLNGMQVFRVDAESHISFGYRQPSSCG